MYNAGLATPITSSGAQVKTGRIIDESQLTQQLEMLDWCQHAENRNVFPKTQLRRPDHQMRRVARMGLEAKQRPETADARVAQRLRPGVFRFAGGARWKTWLNDALAELADCPEAAVEEGLDEPSKIGLEKADAVLRGVSGLVEEQPDIYPMEAGGIVIDLRGPDVPSSVLMVVESDGSGALFYRASGKKGRARVDDAAGLPDLLKALGLSPVKATENR